LLCLRREPVGEWPGERNEWVHLRLAELLDEARDRLLALGRPAKSTANRLGRKDPERKAQDLACEPGLRWDVPRQAWRQVRVALTQRRIRPRWAGTRRGQYRGQARRLEHRPRPGRRRHAKAGQRLDERAVLPVVPEILGT